MLLHPVLEGLCPWRVQWQAKDLHSLTPASNGPARYLRTTFCKTDTPHFLPSYRNNLEVAENYGASKRITIFCLCYLNTDPSNTASTKLSWTLEMPYLSRMEIRDYRSSKVRKSLTDWVPFNCLLLAPLFHKLCLRKRGETYNFIMNNHRRLVINHLHGYLFLI